MEASTLTPFVRAIGQAKLHLAFAAWRACKWEVVVFSNELGDEAVRQIVEKIEGGMGVESITLESNNITPTGALFLAGALAGTDCIQWLNLRDNSIGYEGFHHICDALRTNKSLTGLCVKGNGLDETSIADLDFLLRRNKTLRTLWIQNNQFPGYIIRGIVRLLRDNKSLRDFQLLHDGYRIADGDEKERIAEVYRGLLKVNYSLVDLDGLFTADDANRLGYIPAGARPFPLLAANGHTGCVYEMLEGGDVPPNEHNNAALRWAVRGGHEDVVEGLMEDERVNVADNDCQSLAWALRGGRVDIAARLLEDPNMCFQACMAALDGPNEVKRCTPDNN